MITTHPSPRSLPSTNLTHQTLKNLFIPVPFFPQCQAGVATLCNSVSHHSQVGCAGLAGWANINRTSRTFSRIFLFFPPSIRRKCLALCCQSDKVRFSSPSDSLKLVIFFLPVLADQSSMTIFTLRGGSISRSLLKKTKRKAVNHGKKKRNNNTRRNTTLPRRNLGFWHAPSADVVAVLLILSYHISIAAGDKNNNNEASDYLYAE